MLQDYLFLKKLVSIFLLFCLIAPITGTYIWLKYEKKRTRHEVKSKMMERLDENDLVLLKFSTVDKELKLNWEHSNEFEYKGQMYDIVETKISGDTTYYTCWWDNDETKLNKKLTNLVSDVLGKNQQNKENNKRLIQFFKSLYHTKNFDFVAHYQLTDKKYFINNSGSNTSFSLDPLVPPPQLLYFF